MSLYSKLFQGLKRLMTKCQQYFPTDPSRSMDFQKQDTDPEPEEKKEVVVPVRTVEFTSGKSSESSSIEIIDKKE